MSTTRPPPSVSAPPQAQRGSAPARPALRPAPAALAPLALPGGGILQPRLKVSQPGDPLELEADRMAERVMRMADPAAGAARQGAAPVPAGSSDLLRRHWPSGEEDVLQRRALEPDAPGRETPALDRVQAVLRHPGQPLDAHARIFFEPRFGVDLGAVRVHTDGAAAESARSLQAQAYTVGHHLVFDAGRYAPHTGPGRQLLAHELSHVLQQGAASAPHTVQRKPETKPPGRRKRGPSRPEFTTLYLEGDASAAEWAQRGAQLAKDLNSETKQKLDFVLLVVTDGLHVFSASAELKASFKLTAAPPVLGLFIGGGVNSTLQAKIDRQGKPSFQAIGGWDPKFHTPITEWTTVTPADEEKYFGGDKVPIIIIPGVPADAAADTRDASAVPEGTPDPNARPVREPAPGSDKPGILPGKLERPASGDEFEAGETAAPANYPAFPARIQTSSTLVPVSGSSELTMHLDWTYGEQELIGAVWNASTLVRYQWERWDITKLVVGARADKKALAQQARQAPRDRSAAVKDQHAVQDARQRLSDLKEDASNSAGTIRSGGTAGDSVDRRMRDVETELGNLAMLPVSAIASAGGHLIDRAWHAATKPDNEITLAWKEPGHYLIRCVASPRTHGGRRYMSSVATALVEARDTLYLAQDAMGVADAVIDELMVKLMRATEPGEIARLATQLEDARIGAYGSAVEALELAVRRKQQEVDAAIGRYRGRRKDELKALQKQLEIAKSTEARLLPRTPGSVQQHALRPQAAIASEVTGSSYPLLLQLVPLSQGARPRWALYDVSGVGDGLGRAHVGEGDTDGAAIARAFKEFAAANDYGRGVAILDIPATVANVSRRRLVERNVHRGTALAKDRLHDLVAVLTAVSLVIPGVGEAAMLLGGALAAEHLLERWQHGTLAPDASFVSDVLGVLGAAGGVAGRVAGLVVVRSEAAFAVAIEKGEVAALERALVGLNRATILAQAVRIGNEIVAYGGLLWGEIETLREIEKINAEEEEGKITHSAARSARARAVLGAVQNHVLMFTGPLHESLSPERAEPRGAGTAEHQGEGAARGDTVGSGPGAVRGKESYPLRGGTGEKPLKTDSRAVRDRVLEGAASREAAGDAELHGGARGRYTLEVAGTPGRKATKVALKVEMVGGFDSASTPHGGDEGPVRLELVRSGGRWEATVSIHEMVAKDDLKWISGHEIDEIVEIIRGSDPAVSDQEATLLAREQMQAEVFRPGAASGKAATAHDKAAARELGTALAELAAAQTRGEKQAARTRIAAMKKSMGLNEVTGAAERLAALEQMQVLSAEDLGRVREELLAMADATDMQELRARSRGEPAGAGPPLGPREPIAPDDPQRGVKLAIARIEARLPQIQAEIAAAMPAIRAEGAKLAELYQRLIGMKRDAPGRAELFKEYAASRDRLAKLQKPKFELEEARAELFKRLPILRKALQEETYSRPAFRTDMARDVWALALVDGKGTVKSPSGTELKFTDPWVIGHKPGYEFWKHQLSAARRGITREQFIEEYNRSPAHYRPETVADNSSHKYEDHSDTYYGY